MMVISLKEQYGSKIYQQKDEQILLSNWITLLMAMMEILQIQVSQLSIEPFTKVTSTSVLIIYNPVDTGRKLNVFGTSRTSSERLMYVQFTSCVYGESSQFGSQSTGLCNGNMDLDWIKILRSSHRRCSVRKGVLRNIANSQEKSCVRVSFLKKLQVLACNFI